MASMRNQVQLSPFTDWIDFSGFKSTERAQASVGTMLDPLLAWSGALQPLRKA